MSSRTLVVLILSTLSLALSSPSIGAGETKYKNYERSQPSVELFRITYDKKQITVSAIENGTVHNTTCLRKNISVTSGEVRAEGNVLLDRTGLILDDIRFDFDRILDIRIVDDDDVVSISFLTGRSDSPRTTRMKLGNRITFSKTTTIDEDEFVRGIVLSITGDIEIYGEVNKDVVSLFGDIYVGSAAVARGDLASITGRADVARDASVYGEIYSGTKRSVTRRHRFRRRADRFDWSAVFCYNRVDGLLLGAEAKFEDPDSLLPSVWAKTAYAFESKRWRFDLGLEQTILRAPALAVGGNYHRWLTSEDYWLLDDRENSVFALLATEDFMDYYETEGGGLYLKFRPIRILALETGFHHEETRWLKANPDLWSLFGGHKRFRENFSTVDSAAFRDQGVLDINSGVNGFMTACVDLDTRTEAAYPFERSAWHLTGTMEWSGDGLSSDYCYRRYTLAVRRYQRIHRRSMFLLRGIYGGSDGYLPMHKRFFLGGLGTLRGYAHKEYMGTRFWMANAEYRVSFPRSDLAASIFWDVGQIANDAKLDRLTEVKHSVGIALHFGDDVRINLSKRLDQSYDDGPKIYVRLEHVF